MKKLKFQMVLHWLRIYGRICIFLFHAGLLVPGIIFWTLFILLHGDLTALAYAFDNLISRYLDANITEQQKFLNLLYGVALIIYAIVAGFRWPSLWRVLSMGREYSKEPEK